MCNAGRPTMRSPIHELAASEQGKYEEKRKISVKTGGRASLYRQNCMARASDYVSFVLWLPRAANGEPHFVWVRVMLSEWINGAVPVILTSRFRQIRQGLVSRCLSLNNQALVFVSDSNLANLYQQLTNLKWLRIDRGACLPSPLQLLSDAQQRVLLRQAWSLNFQLPHWGVSPTEYGVILLPVKLLKFTMMSVQGKLLSHVYAKS